MKYLCFCLAVLLAACQSPPAARHDPANADAATPPVERAFEPDSLYRLLIGEMALHRELYPLALNAYLQQAEHTRDAGIAARSSEIAAALNAQPVALQSALLWSTLEPDNPRARFLAAVTLLQQDRLPEALVHMQASYALGGGSRFSALAAKISDPALGRHMAENIGALLKRDRRNPDLLLSDAMLAFAAGAHRRALGSVRAVLAQHPEDLRAVALESRILLALKRPQDALARFKALLDDEPDNLRLHMEYARALARVSPVDARQEFALLAGKHPDQAELLLALALLARETGDSDTARAAFDRLLELGHYRNEAHFYLGVMAIDRNDPGAAIRHLGAVTPGNAFLDARRRLVGLLLAEDRLMEALERLRRDRASMPDDGPYAALQLELALMEAEALLEKHYATESLAVLNRLIEDYGPQARLLYTRSLAHERLGDLAALERDLRDLLERNPDNATVLNALGYSLTNLSSRHTEALQLIERAHRLQPDDAAILDSLGWVHFRLGNLRRARDYLQQAYAHLPDAEIGAHLGELLWLHGDRQQALQIWRESFNREPTHPVLRETVERLTGQPLEMLGHAAR